MAFFCEFLSNLVDISLQRRQIIVNIICLADLDSGLLPLAHFVRLGHEGEILLACNRIYRATGKQKQTAERNDELKSRYYPHGIILTAENKKSRRKQKGQLEAALFILSAIFDESIETDF
jgi:hypothetical protein